MGFDRSAIRFLLHLQQQGVSFNHTITLGRQSYQLPESELKKCFADFQFNKTGSEELMVKDDYFVEPFLMLLGANKVDSMDASTYEGASVIHDLNLPLPAQLLNQYDVVIDAGTLEHVFHFPQAIANAMQMLKPGGSFVGITTSNNFFGHGFYQFSPELFYRVFSAENGFEVEHLYFTTTEPGAEWYEVPDPKKVRGRVILENSYQSYLLIHARKLTDTILFQKTPQQSDYELIAWENTEIDKTKPGRKSLLRIRFTGLRYAMNNIKTSVLGRRIKTILRPYGSGSKLYFKKVIKTKK